MNKDFNITPLTPELQCHRPHKSLLRISKKKVKKIRQCHQRKHNRKIGMWSLTQTINYISFIRDNSDKLESTEVRRKEKVFILMAKELRSRSSVQCRSHHQKMLQTYGSRQNIIDHYANSVIPYYQARLKQLQATQRPIPEPIPFCVVFQTNNLLRIELNAQMILSY